MGTIVDQNNMLIDAAGNSGLINLVLKNKTTIGFDGSLTSTYIQRTNAGIMPSANFTYSAHKLTIGLNLFADQETRTADSDIDIIFSDFIRASKTDRVYKTRGFVNGLSIDYSFNKSNVGVVLNTDW
ncbi:MAG: hypothetical protein RL662_2471 [Bacteroidota bacterium]